MAATSSLLPTRHNSSLSGVPQNLLWLHHPPRCWNSKSRNYSWGFSSSLKLTFLTASWVTTRPSKLPPSFCSTCEPRPPTGLHTSAECSFWNGVGVHHGSQLLLASLTIPEGFPWCMFQGVAPPHHTSPWSPTRVCSAHHSWLRSCHQPRAGTWWILVIQMNEWRFILWKRASDLKEKW